ncbi:Larval cuticle protein [Dirofilaria immitis]
MVSSFVIFLILNIFIGINFTAIDVSERRLIHRNFYWYTMGKEERRRSGSTPFGFDHLPSQTVLCVILHKTVECDKVIEALKHYKEYNHTDQFS